jgi:hypothetical protein
VPADEASVEVESSVGPLRIVFGWNAWMSVHAAAHQVNAAVRRRRDLERLLVSLGVGAEESKRLSADLRKRRPRESRRGEVEDPWEGFGRGWLGLATFLAAAACIVVFLVFTPWP